MNVETMNAASGSNKGVLLGQLFFPNDTEGFSAIHTGTLVELLLIW